MNELDLRQELLAAFEAEYREHLQAIRATLDSPPVEGGALRDVFRRAHSLKGAARAVDLPQLEAIAHELETLLYRSVERGEALSAESVVAVQRGLDAIEARMRGPDRTEMRPEPAGQGSAPGSGPGSGPGSDPGPDPGRDPGPDPGRDSAPVPTTDPASSAVRVPAIELDRLGAAVQALSESVQRQEQASATLAGVGADARALLALWETIPRGSTGADVATDPGRAFERQLRLLSRRLDGAQRERSALDWQLQQASQALRTQVEQLVLVTAGSVFELLGGMARDLAREAGTEIEIRLEGMALRAERSTLQALRDPAIQLLRNAIGHGIRPGGHDRSDGTLPRIELRLALQAGRLELLVADDGPGPDLARIERTAIRRGLLPPREAASDASPVPGPGARPGPDQTRLLALVFEPGFSTAEAVDRLSGRGMGLSIVAEAARRLHGTAVMRPGRDPAGAVRGTEILVSVPLAARRQALLLVEAAGHMIGLPAASVVRLLRVPAAGIEWPEGRPVARPGAREVLALSALSPLLGGTDPLLASKPTPGPQPERPGPDRMLPVVVLSTAAADAGAQTGLVVERLHDVRTLLVQAPDLVGIDRDLVVGLALAHGDRPVLVLDPDALSASLAAALAARPPPSPDLAPDGAAKIRSRGQATILVVDDSITTRTLEKTILQAQGYRVLIAVDGLEALTVLRTAQWEIDVVVADVEMPRLDGFGLLAAMREDPRLAGIPTVLMTSRNQEADIRRGLELGARAYIAKQAFDQGLLLATIGRLLP